MEGGGDVEEQAGLGEVEVEVTKEADEVTGGRDLGNGEVVESPGKWPCHLDQKTLMLLREMSDGPRGGIPPDTSKHSCGQITSMIEGEVPSAD